jgi:bla regulator protein blaR1
MSGLAVSWLSRDESIALGWTLLHFCWQGTAIAALFALVDRMTSRASSGVRYALAFGALALMPLVALATFASEMQTLAMAKAVGTVGQATHLLISPSPQLSLIRQSYRDLPPAIQNPEVWLTSRVQSLLPWVDVIWMLGILLLAVRATGGWRQLEQLRKNASGLVPAQVRESLFQVCERVNVGRRITLRVSDQVISPMVMGIWHATVILPVSAILHLTPEELEAVLAHELGHVRRWDYACNLMQTALETLLFFHPAVWWMSRTVRDRREVCCDEIAVRSCSDPVVYAKTLLRLEEQKTRTLELAVALKGNSGSLLGRIEKVLGEDEPMEHRMTSGIRLLVVCTIMLGLMLGPKVRDAVAASQPVVKNADALVSHSASPVAKESLQKAVPRVDPIQLRVAPNPGEAAESQPVARALEVASVSADVLHSQELGMMQAETKTVPKGISFIDGMRDAGYPLDLNNDLNTLISLKSLGVTPEYAKAMGALGFGKPTVHELISLKALGVTPEYVAELKQSGLGPKDFHEVTTEKALGLTPEYAAAMKKANLGDLSLHDLISLKAQNVTPEYIDWAKQQFPQITLPQLRQAAVFHLDAEFITQAKSHGFDGKDLDKLLRLKISGLLDEQ